MNYMALATIFARVLIMVRNILSFHSFFHDNLWYFNEKKKRKKGNEQLSINVVRTYVIHLLGTYVTILCNWLIF